MCEVKEVADAPSGVMAREDEERTVAPDIVQKKHAIVSEGDADEQTNKRKKKIRVMSPHYPRDSVDTPRGDTSGGITFNGKMELWRCERCWENTGYNRMFETEEQEKHQCRMVQPLSLRTQMSRGIDDLFWSLLKVGYDDEYWLFEAAKIALAERYDNHFRPK